MKLTEIAVILFGLFAGYWVVSKLFFGKKIDNDKSPISPSNVKPVWNEILQIAPSATVPEIREAYKHLISMYHPDKVDSLGQELKDLAIQKSKDITAAYREGMHARGADP